MFVDFRHRAGIAASIGKALDAVTTVDGIREWSSSAAKGGAAAGGAFDFRRYHLDVVEKGASIVRAHSRVRLMRG